MAQLLSNVAVGTLVNINENGSLIQFYVAKHDYESSLNGAGRTLVVRKDTYEDRAWDSDGSTAYASSDLDSWFNSTYKNRLDADIRSLIGTTKIRYTLGNRNYTVGTLERAIFALSLTELGKSHSYANTEGFALPIASTLQIAYRNGSATTQWTRSPSTSGSNQAWRLLSNGDISEHYCYQSSGARPAFTLPSTVLVDDSNTVLIASLILSITVPSLAMQGQSIPISWASLPLSGSDVTYQLQRNADDGGWTTIYTGADTLYTDTAGTWTTVQYQVAAVVEGTIGDYMQSPIIPVVSSAVLVISGQDGNLGTLTSNLPYTVSSNTGNPISLTRTVNGAQVVTLTVESGFAYSIPIADLPTGTGTIQITASVESDSGTATTTRTWTYYKTPIDIPSTGGIAQLTQKGQNIWPTTIADAVQAPAYLGGNLNAALNKLGQAITKNSDGSITDVFGYDVPICQYEVGSYVGTGQYGSSNPNTLTFGFEPKFICIRKAAGTQVYGATLINGQPTAQCDMYGTSDNRIASILWNNGIVSWYSSSTSQSQLNAGSVVYYYIAIG